MNMTRLQFILSLNNRLSGLPQGEIEKQIQNHCDRIDALMAEGMSEEEAVAAVDAMEELPPAAPSSAKSRRPLKWELVALALTSPLWLPLLVAGFALFLALYLTLWALIVALWAVFGGAAGCALGGIFAGIVLSMGGFTPTGTALVGCGLICTGIAILLFIGCKAAARDTLAITRKLIQGIYQCFRRKEGA